MIQRIQTVYLLLAFTCAILLLFFPFFSLDISLDAVSYHAEFGAYGLVAEEAFNENLAPVSVPIYAVFVLLALLTLSGVFLYRNRKKQLVVTWISLVLHVLVAIGFYAFYYFGRSFLADSVEPQHETATIRLGTEAGFYLLVATIPLLYLAIRGIRRDENLVKSLDRLR